MDGGPKSRPRFHSTFDIIEAVEGGRFPEGVMMTFHPQRWTDNPVEWGKELVWQNFKNVIKKGMVSRKDAKPQRFELATPVRSSEATGQADPHRHTERKKDEKRSLAQSRRGAKKEKAN